MRFVSTRGVAPAVDFEGALMAGLAPDGGLYTPEHWPRLSTDEIADLAGRPYAEVAARILSPFVGESLEPAALRRLCQAAYARFAHPAVAPLVQIGPASWRLELFHGPSLAFKDIAMQLLAQLYGEMLARRDGRLTIICATSGDTGGAAVEAFAGVARTDVVVLFPEGRISEVQRRFITASPESNVHALAVQGDFDACQALVKRLFRDADFAREARLTAVNSINIVRILAQAVYYATSAVALGAATPSTISGKIRFAVPTGNFGDAFAGWAARAMGLPIGEILAATNRNDILPRAFASGVYVRGTLAPTQSPAMDIQAASNFERLVFEALGRDAAATAAAFEGFEAGGALNLSGEALNAIRALGPARAVDEAETSRTMALAHDRGLGFVDPHTAVALAAAGILEAGDTREASPRVVLATAHPAKFPEAVSAATGDVVPPPAQVLALNGRPERVIRLPADLDALKSAIAGCLAL